MKKLLFNPFKRYQAKRLIAIGLIFTVLGSVLAAAFNTHFDGVLDIHSAIHIKFWQPFAENAIDIAVLWVLFVVAGKYLNRKTRFIDILATCLVARTPVYVTPLFNINDFMARSVNRLMLNISHHAPAAPSSTALLIAFSVIEILLIIWYIVLLFNGFKTDANAQGMLANILFILAVILAEIASKFILYNIQI